MKANRTTRQLRSITTNIPRKFWQYLLETIWTMAAGATVSSLGSWINDHHVRPKLRRRRWGLTLGILTVSTALLNALHDVSHQGLISGIVA